MARRSSSAAGERLAMRQHFERVDSTQRVAIDLARSGAMAGTVVVADRQEEGRGRLDHRWASPPGGLYLSVLVDAPPQGGLLVPLAAGAALSTALAPYSARPLLKWPNDLVVVDPPRPPRKLAGILVDAVGAPDGRRLLAVGVGVNVAAPPTAYPPDLRPRVVQLSELAGRPVRVEEVERAVVPAVAGAVPRLRTAEGRDGVLERCRAQLYGRGRPVRVDGVPAGVLHELDEDGALLVDDGPRQTRVVAGDLLVEDR
jgi:BirA family transcriptional regulator, biotin operon repressor / biotin---[acetyl-CoA-carboxylase] ligase